uniref:Peptide deformylase n=1 Tax=Timema bartmani TaxID=61472 RepID=A0A7R9EZH6_9NEOP|nr:unnamed protein product [Timema bartmani]
MFSISSKEAPLPQHLKEIQVVLLFESWVLPTRRRGNLVCCSKYSLTDEEPETVMEQQIDEDDEQPADPEEDVEAGPVEEQVAELAPRNTEYVQLGPFVYGRNGFPWSCIRASRRELKPPRAHRPRFAMVHLGNGIGFVEAAEPTFLCKKNTADAHDEMDGDIYEKWFSEQLLPNTPEGAVIVIDNAAYHNRREDRKKEISPEIYKLRDMSTIPLQVFINPKMKVQNYEKLVFPEGCESVRGFAADVPRYKEVTVSVKYHFIMLF